MKKKFHFKKMFKKHDNDNPPLKFEEIEAHKPYWDNENKEWCYVIMIYSYIQSIRIILLRDNPVDRGISDVYGRFYRREVKE